MKKIICILLIGFLLCGCTSDMSHEETNPDERYYGMITLIKDCDTFQQESGYFDIYAEMAAIDDGYRFYVVVDKPRIAMYDVNILCIENGVDYTKNMAANVGIFDEKKYNMIPNQINIDKGYVEGLVASGISTDKECELYVLVQWKSKDLSNIKREYFKLDVSFMEKYD